MRELNECRELMIDELDQVSGGDKVEVTSSSTIIFLSILSPRPMRQRRVLPRVA